jgi:hypothetical protein
MPPPAALAIEFAFALVAYSLIVKWYVLPALAGLPLGRALTPLLLVHLLRPVTLWLLFPGVIVDASLPREFAVGTAYGDLLSAALALVAVLLLRSVPRVGVACTWLFNVVGTLDILRNLSTGVRLGVAPHMGAAVLIPAFGVPLLLVDHALVFVLLLRHGRPPSEG